MTSSITTRLRLPLLAPGQAGKEITHNEALALLDLAVAPSVAGVRASPPSAPGEGDAWLVDASAGGAWTGHDGAIAGWTAGGWRFVQLPAGAAIEVVDSLRLERRGDGWHPAILRGAGVRVGDDIVVAARGAAVAEPAGGGIVDAEARAVLLQVLDRLRAHGLIAR